MFVLSETTDITSQLVIIPLLTAAKPPKFIVLYADKSMPSNWSDTALPLRLSGYATTTFLTRLLSEISLNNPRSIEVLLDVVSYLKLFIVIIFPLPSKLVKFAVIGVQSSRTRSFIKIYSPPATIDLRSCTVSTGRKFSSPRASLTTIVA